MGIEYLHTMVRVKDLDQNIEVYKLLGLEETRRHDNEGGRFTLVFMAPPGQPECPVELTYNWDGDDELPSDSRHFGHLAYRVDDIPLGETVIMRCLGMIGSQRAIIESTPLKSMVSSTNV